MDIKDNIKINFSLKQLLALRFSAKQKVFAFLLILSVFSCCLFTMRMYVTDDLYYGFLVWNLFLAWVPFGFALWSHSILVSNRKKWRIMIPLFFWLIFFPNAPYLITDLVHLRDSFQIPMWYDSLLVFSFALTGLVVGFASLLIIHRIIRHQLGSFTGWIVMFFIFITTGFGIYIGRILRWNSWDIVINTASLFTDISDHALTKTSLAMTTSFSGFIAVAYLFVYFLLRFSTKPVQI